MSRINQAILEMDYSAVLEVFEMQNELALKERFTYLLGPIKIALRPRVITVGQVEALKDYGAAVWSDCLVLEQMWQGGELDEVIKIEVEELEIARMQPWGGSPAIIAADGLFGFGASPDRDELSD